ncbi:MAG: hypothetical protein AAF581_21410 [Planctomycetota bacterium]
MRCTLILIVLFLTGGFAVAPFGSVASSQDSDVAKGSGDSKADKAKVSAETKKCSANLRAISALAVTYADERGGKLPFYKKAKKKDRRAFQSLNMLVSWAGDKAKPEMFVCPNSKKKPAKADKEGKFTLTAATCSYRWPSYPMRLTDESDLPLACCTDHDGFVNVITLGGSVSQEKDSKKVLRGLVGND